MHVNFEFCEQQKQNSQKKKNVHEIQNAQLLNDNKIAFISMMIIMCVDCSCRYPTANRKIYTSNAAQLVRELIIRINDY